jgi:hypothetical protein
MQSDGHWFSEDVSSPPATIVQTRILHVYLVYDVDAALITGVDATCDARV